MIVGTESGEPITVSLDVALGMANEQELDLVQMSTNGDIAICKIMNYSKYLYDQKKKEKQHTKPKQELKEVRISDGIADNDLKTKANNVCRILDEGDKVKVTITYKGRAMSFINRGVDKLNNFEKMIEFSHTVDRQPKIEGNRVYMVLSPKK